MRRSESDLPYGSRKSSVLLFFLNSRRTLRSSAHLLSSSRVQLIFHNFPQCPVGGKRTEDLTPLKVFEGGLVPSYLVPLEIFVS